MNKELVQIHTLPDLTKRREIRLKQLPAQQKTEVMYMRNFGKKHHTVTPQNQWF